MDTKILAQPLISHYHFLEYILSTRYGDNDIAFQTPINEFDFAPGEIFFHGVHALYRAIKIQEGVNLEFRQINMPRKQNLGITEELLVLYREAIDNFIQCLENLGVNQLDETIESPLNGKPIKLKKWFSQTVMHTIHHIGQAVRMQGIVDRKLNNKKPTYETASDYTLLYKV